MPSWLKTLLAEATDPEFSALQRDEAEYKLFKKALTGQRPEPSDSRKAFLENYKDWVFEHKVGNPSLSRGQAIIQAKKVFFDPEMGAPKFFEPQRTLQIKKVEAEPVEDGWEVAIEFKAQFKKERGARVQPTEEELASLGFFEIEYHDTEPEVGDFKLEIILPNNDGLDQNAIAKAAQEEAKKLISGLLKDVEVQNVDLRKKTDNWKATFYFKGLPLAPLSELEKKGILET